MLNPKHSYKAYSKTDVNTSDQLTLIIMLYDGLLRKGYYTFTWNGSGMPSGMYVINAEYNNTSISHNISLIK